MSPDSGRSDLTPREPRPAESAAAFSRRRPIPDRERKKAAQVGAVRSPRFHNFHLDGEDPRGAQPRATAPDETVTGVPSAPPFPDASGNATLAPRPDVGVR